MFKGLNQLFICIFQNNTKFIVYFNEMNTKLSITPWYQPQIKSFKLHYLQSPINLFDELKQEEKIYTGKTLSLPTENRSKKQIRKASKQFVTLDTRGKSIQLENNSWMQKRQDSTLIKKFIVYRERRIWNRKRSHFESIDEDEIFRPKKQLISDKNELKLPKVNLKVLH